MKKRVFLYAAKVSTGARLLSKALGIKKIRTSNSHYKPRKTDLIVNWGNTIIPEFSPARVLNPPQSIMNASNKMLAYQLLRDAEVPIPQFTDDKEVVIKWLKKGYVVLGRKLLRASEGRGIVLLSPDDDEVERKLTCPLYTLYRKKKDEYRVHIMNGVYFDGQQKRRATSDGRWKGDNRIRNTIGGWVFAREGVHLPEPIIEAATKAVRALDLDFGAVDCGYAVSKGEATVYEVNTAPGLSGTTLRNYAAALRRQYMEVHSH